MARPHGPRRTLTLTLVVLGAVFAGCLTPGSNSGAPVGSGDEVDGPMPAPPAFIASALGDSSLAAFSYLGNRTWARPDPPPLTNVSTYCYLFEVELTSPGWVLFSIPLDTETQQTSFDLTGVISSGAEGTTPYYEVFQLPKFMYGGAGTDLATLDARSGHDGAPYHVIGSTLQGSYNGFERITSFFAAPGPAKFSIKMVRGPPDCEPERVTPAAFGDDVRVVDLKNAPMVGGLLMEPTTTLHPQGGSTGGIEVLLVDVKGIEQRDLTLKNDAVTVDHEVRFSDGRSSKSPPVSGWPFWPNTVFSALNTTGGDFSGTFALRGPAYGAEAAAIALGIAPGMWRSSNRDVVLQGTVIPDNPSSVP